MGISPFLISGLGGAAIMYFLDPQAGRRRRALLRDKWASLQNTVMDQAPERLDRMAEDVSNRARGVVAEAERHLKNDDQDNTSDETLIARVRSEMGRYVSHPGAIEVKARQGVVTLSGDILTKEAQAFVTRVKAMPGVNRVENQLQQHTEAGNNPNLQGGKTRTELQ